MTRRWNWPLTVLTLAPIALLAPLVAGGVLYWGVPLLQFYGWQSAAAEALRAGQLPLWNSLVGSGAPLAANLQTGAFYPLNALHLLLPTEYAQSYTALLHVILAGWFMYAYLRSLRLSSWAALIGAVAFQLCGFLIARLAFFSITAAVPWIAAWLWRTERLVAGGQWSVVSDSANPPRALVTRHSSLANALWLALVIGLGVLAGHAQTAVYGLVLIGAYGLWRAISTSPQRRISTATARTLVILAVAIGLGLALAAVQLLPAAELTRESQRAGGLDATKILSHSFWPLRLLTLLSPDFFGNPAQNNFWGYDNYWENAAYIGLLPVLLALWIMGKKFREWGARIRHRGAGSRDQRSLRATPHAALVTFFSLTASLSFILALGWFTPIYPLLFDTVPGFDLFQGPARWLIITSVALCVLAAYGAQHWLEHGISRRAARRWLVLGAALALAGAAALVILPGRVATFGPATLRLGVLLIISGMLFQTRIQQPKFQIAVIAVIVLDLISAHVALNPTLPADLYHAPNPAAEAIRADGARGRVFTFDSDENAIKFGKYLATDQKFAGYGPNTLAYWLDFRQTLTPNAAQLDGVASANNFDSLLVGRYQAVLDQVNARPLTEALPILSRLNVAYILSPRVLPLPIVAQTPDVTIYRNAAVLPRAWIAAPEADLSQVDTPLPGSAVESLTDSGNTVTIRAASPQAGWLILSDVWYPGWQATVDGAAVPIEMANGAVRAVRFPAGTHTVIFNYAPASAALGGLITVAVGLIGSIGLGWTYRRAHT